MKFLEFIRNEIDLDDLTEGRYYPYYLLDYQECHAEKFSYIHKIVIRERNGRNYYNVEINANGDNIISVSCNCNKFKKTHSCPHIPACLIQYRGYLREKYIVNVYEESINIIDFFYKPSTTPEIKQKLNLEVNIIFYDNKWVFRLSIGSSKLYVLNTKTKFINFLNAYYTAGDMVLGSKLTYNKNKYYFLKEDNEIINFLSNFAKEDDYGDIFIINERDLIHLLDLVPIGKLKINGTLIKEIIKDLPSDFKLAKNINNNYELKLELPSVAIILTPNFKYILINNTLYIVPDEYRELISLLKYHEIDSLLFKEDDLAKFSGGVLPKIRNKLTTSDELKDLITSKPIIELYFDIGSNLTCKPLFKYKDLSLKINDEVPNLIRDKEMEDTVINELTSSGFILNKDKFIISDIDLIGSFIENNLPELTNKYNIYTTKNFNKVSLIKNSQIKKDFKIGTSGIMSFDFSIDNIEMNELPSIIASLENKKTYHKLKNGSIINLEENSELQELSNLINDLDLSNKELSNSIVIPKYKALYLDSLRTNKYHDINTNNIFDNFIKNFKEYQNIKINLSKEDNQILRDYQKIGVRWLYALYKCDLGGILADEMGLGKSIQTICFIKEILKEHHNAKILIVCPTSLVYNWENEFKKFGSDLKYTTISESKSLRSSLINNKEYNIYITSYGLLRNDIEEYQKIDYEVCIIDEAQYIKNYQAKMTIALKQIKAHTRIALTGTPLENSVTELWSIFDFLMPGYLNSVKKFHEKYHINDVTKEDLEKLKTLNYQIKPFILRRKKNDVSKDLPEKIENTIYLNLPDSQKKLYLSVLKETEKEINEIIAKEGFKKARFKILTLLTKLREICIDPNVLYENYLGEAIKIDKIREMIQDYAKENHKILIFSSFKRVLDGLKVKLNEDHISFYSIDGGTKNNERVNLVDKFNNDDTACFLITLKSGGTGLNLTGADVVIHLDIWWNPQAENQATDRAHRIGQTRNVIVNKLITKGTIEERILELQTKKRILSDNLIEGNDIESLSNLSEDDLKNLLTFSCED